MKSTHILHILMNGMLVGQLEKNANGSMTFTYEKSWINTPGARPISLSLPLVDKAFTGNVVYNFFDNLLPDNSQIRARIQAKFQIPTNQPYDLLASIGRDCVGAIQLVEGEIPPFDKDIKFERLTDKEIATIMQGYQQYPLGMTDPSSDFRISLAGAQEKSAFLYHQDKWCRPLRETPTTHIFKLPIGFLEHQQIDLSDSCENEWLCSEIAAAFGLPVAKCEILLFDNVKVLAVQRFDRKLSADGTWLMRLPQEDICQTLGVSPNLKYQADGGPGIRDIMRLLLGSEKPTENRDTFFRSQILFWLLAAIDGHAKNFSVFIDAEGKFNLTPLYDIISAYPLIAKNYLAVQKIKMAMALEGKNTHYHWHHLQRRYFLETANQVNYPVETAESILDDMLQKVDSVIATVSTKLPASFPRHISQPIFDGIKSAALKLTK